MVNMRGKHIHLGTLYTSIWFREPGVVICWPQLLNSSVVQKHAPFPQWTFLAADQPIFQLLRPDVDWCYWRPAALPLLFWKKKQKMIPYKTLILSWSGCSMASRCQFSFWDYNFQHCWRQPGPAWQAKASWPIWTCTQWLLCHCHLGPIHFDINMSTGGNFEYGNVAFLGCDWKIG